MTKKNQGNFPSSFMILKNNTSGYFKFNLPLLSREILWPTPYSYRSPGTVSPSVWYVRRRSLSRPHPHSRCSRPGWWCLPAYSRWYRSNSIPPRHRYCRQSTASRFCMPCGIISVCSVPPASVILLPSCSKGSHCHPCCHCPASAITIAPLNRLPCLFMVFSFYLIS